MSEGASAKRPAYGAVGSPGARGGRSGGAASGTPQLAAACEAAGAPVAGRVAGGGGGQRGPRLPLARVERSILLLRGQKVILDADLAKLYHVTTKRLSEQVKRNAARFPPDFAFQLSQEEHGA